MAETTYFGNILPCPESPAAPEGDSGGPAYRLFFGSA
jgi:hypothetical protein